MAKHAFEYDDEMGTFSGPGHKLNEVLKLVEGERVRRDRWHATYNAALTAMLARVPWNVTVVDEPKFHRSASEFADRAHGSIGS